MSPKAKNKGLLLNVNFDPGIIEKIFVDELKLRQIVLNLIDNSIKYTKSGYVEIFIQSEIFAKTNLCDLRIVITDSGIGIEQDKLNEILKPFVRVSKERNYKQGLGLGLTVATRFAESIGASFTIDSEIGKGTRVEVVLKKLRYEGYGGEIQKLVMPGDAELKGKVVYIVTDDLKLLEILSDSLSESVVMDFTLEHISLKSFKEEREIESIYFIDFTSFDKAVIERTLIETYDGKKIIAIVDGKDESMNELA